MLFSEAELLPKSFQVVYLGHVGLDLLARRIAIAKTASAKAGRGQDRAERDGSPVLRAALSCAALFRALRLPLFRIV